MTFKKGHPNYITEESKKRMSLVAKEKRFGKWMNGKHLSEETKKKMSLSHKGIPSKLVGRKLSEEHKKKIKENHCRYWLGKKGDIRLSRENSSAWIGGKSFEEYGEDFNIFLKNSIRKRDNQICMNCGIHREKLNESLICHHINYDKKCSIKENLICLCRRCHGLTQINREYWIKLFQEKLSKLYNYQYYDNQIILNLNGAKDGI